MRSPLLQLARSAGIATHWTDAFGQGQDVSHESLRAILKAMRFSSDTDAECSETLAALHSDGGDPPELPMLTTWAGEAAELKHRKPKDGAAWRVTFEQGGGMSGHLVRSSNGALHLPRFDQTGYHRLEIGDLSTTLAVAPRKSFGVADASARSGASAHAKAWGLSAQLYSLRRQGDGGLADYTALEELACSAGAHGAAALATSPVHAMFSADPGRSSPYGPSSRLFLNAFHIDPAQVAGADALQGVLAAIPDGAKRWFALEQGDLVSWAEAGTLRLDVLRRLFDQLNRNVHDSPRLREFAAFCQRGGQALEDHARFEAIDGWLRQNHPGRAGDWRRWPNELRDPRSAAVDEFSRSHADDVRFHLFLQWLAVEGCESAQARARAAGMPIGLIADLAVGADPGGSQAWGLQPVMLRGLTIGAPPDLLSTQGQNWGLGALSPRALAEQGYSPWLDMLRANMQHSGGIRIDHVLGMARLWLVPQGEPASSGAYVTYPFDDLLRLTALESVRHNAIVVGEDMGTVPDGFSEKLASAGVLGIRALWFQRDGERFLPPDGWPADAMATTSTHDLATLAGWWAECDIDWRERLKLFADNAPAPVQRIARRQDKQALWKAMRASDGALPAEPPASPPIAELLAFTGRTPSSLVMVPLEDLLGIVEQPNLPGTIEVHPNWQQRLPQDAVDMLGTDETAQRLASLKKARQVLPKQSATASISQQVRS